MLQTLLLILLLLTMTQTANAYWLESKPEPFSLQEREHAPPTKGEMFFTIQDNFELFTDEIAPGPMLLPHSDYFVPADIIDVNLPLFGIFSHPVKPAEDPFANMLYANLKMKKLLEEYALIQKSAQELLGRELLHSGQSVQQTTSLSSSYEKQEKKTPNFQESNRNPLQSIYNNLMDLNRTISITQKPTFFSQISSAPSTDQNIPKSQLKPTPTNQPEITAKQNISTPNFTTFSYLQKNNTPDTSGILSQKEDENQTASRKPPSKNLGQFEQTILKLKDYILHNKIECTIYSIILFLVIYIFTFIINAIFGSKIH